MVSRSPRGIMLGTRQHQRSLIRRNRHQLSSIRPLTPTSFSWPLKLYVHVIEARFVSRQLYVASKDSLYCLWSSLSHVAVSHPTPACPLLHAPIPSSLHLAGPIMGIRSNSSDTSDTCSMVIAVVRPPTQRHLSSPATRPKEWRQMDFVPIVELGPGIRPGHLLR